MTAPLRDQLQDTLGGRYTLERELGGGGMSRVFVAREEALGRDVVVKVLAPELAQGVSAERFAREIKLAAALQDPRIVPVLAAGVTADGLPWYTMPFVRGESLRARLVQAAADGHPVPLAEAVAVLRAVAEGLEYAHGHGIVHRDVKPENILLSARTAVVTDFGIAKALAASRTVAPGGPAGVETLTQVGGSLGSPAYMAPEQAVGDVVDARADLYAWGVVAYELLAGRHPFAGKATAQQLIAAQIAEAPRPLGTVAPAVPAPLAAIVMRCLAKDPTQRPASAAELLGGLDGAAAPPSARPPARRWAVAAAAGALVLAGAGGLAWRHARAAAGGPDGATGAPRVAVLPFENAGPADQAYVADGLTDEVRARLTSVPGLTVIARASSNQYRKTAKPLQTVAAELGVRYLLTGTVRSEPGAGGRPARVRVTPELVEVSNDAAPVSRWQQALDADADDVFAMEADIAGRVAGALDVALGAGTRAQLAEVPTRNPAAYDAYLRGEAAADGLARNDPVALRRALAEYTRATALDSVFADAWAQRARAAALLYSNGVPTPALAEDARSASDKARALAPDRPGGALALGEYLRLVTKDNARALAAYTQARRLAPGDAALLGALAAAEQNLGRSADAIRDFQAAAARDPRSGLVARRLAVALLRARRYPEARAAADRALALAPANTVNIENRAMVDLAQGDLAGARRVLAAAPSEVDRDALVAQMCTYWDLCWVLDDAAQRRLLALGPAAFDGDRAAWGLVRMQTFALRGDTANARAYADTAHVALQAQLLATPDDWQRRVFDGLALATLGQRADAVAAAERGAALMPVTRDAYQGAYDQHQLARVYLLTGQLDKALDVLEPLLRMPYHLSPGWLRIDPTFAPLRGNPRFERLAAGTSPAR